MSVELPPVHPVLLVEAVDALPARLRKKIDTMVAAAALWPVVTVGGTTTVSVDAEVTVTMTPVGGVVSAADQVTCCCLLAPRCLHRAAVLARAPIAEAGAEAGPALEAGAAPEAGAVPDAGAVPEAGAAPEVGAAPAPEAGAALTTVQLAAAAGLRQAAAAVLDAGISGTGTVLRAGLLRCAHEARAVGLHRPAAAARRVASRLQAAGQGQPQYRLADLTDDLHELLGVTRRLCDPLLDADAAAPLMGTARRPYDLRGSLRLFGLCTTPVVAESGYAGVVTYLVDRGGRLWTIADLAPGDVDRAATAGDSMIRLGEARASHRDVTRAGLIVSGATASPAGQLGAGRSVRAVGASGVRWQEEPLARLWAEPVDDQIRRAFAALSLGPGERPAGGDLLFLTVRVTGGRGGDVLAVTGDGVVLTLGGPDHAALAYQRNLHLLAAHPGQEYLLICRPDPERPGVAEAIAVAPAAKAAGWTLPETWAGHIDLGYDRLHSSHLPASAAGPAGPDPVSADPAAVVSADPTSEAPGPTPRSYGDPALELVRRQVERVVSGGRAVQAMAQSDEHRLRRARLDTAAALSANLALAARSRPRDTFGRRTSDDGAKFADAWLALAVYTRAASQAMTEACWHSVLSHRVRDHG